LVQGRLAVELGHLCHTHSKHEGSESSAKPMCVV
jgi:hypothetical protein